MQNNRWWRPLLAFLITFGVLAMAASLVRVVAVYQHLFSMGLVPDDPSVAEKAGRELSRMDHMYTPMFLLAATVVSAASAVIFALWRPKVKMEQPPPLPSDSNAETR